MMKKRNRITNVNSATFGSKWSLSTNIGRSQFHVGNKGVFDELVVDHWLHIEQMDERCWWMRVGDADITININEDATQDVIIRRGVHDSTK